MAAHENLAAGLIGAAGALIAAWIAWTAVQDQIRSERERAVADRKEVEAILSHDLSEYAEGMAVAWRLLEELVECHGGEDHKSGVYEAVAYMAERVGRPEKIASYRTMAETLGWDRRLKYMSLLDRLEGLEQFSHAQAIDFDEALTAIRSLSGYFEGCLPATACHFDGLFRRAGKAMTFGDFVERFVPTKFRKEQNDA
jgi:hypothetical protein